MTTPNSADVQKTVRRLTQYFPIPVPLPGTLTASDYLGDTANDDGVPMPAGTLDAARVTLEGADDGNTTIQLENEDSETTHSFTLDADTYTEETGIGLHFSEGDRLSVTITGVTTPGDNGHAMLRHIVDDAPMK